MSDQICPLVRPPYSQYEFEEYIEQVRLWSPVFKRQVQALTTPQVFPRMPESYNPQDVLQWVTGVSFRLFRFYRDQDRSGNVGSPAPNVVENTSAREIVACMVNVGVSSLGDSRLVETVALFSSP